MSFLSIAEPFVALQIPVFPLAPGKKSPVTSDGCKDATLDPAKIAEWNAINPEYNVGIAALAGGEFCFLEFDQLGIKSAAAEMGQPIPQTRMQKSGSDGGHLIFRHTERSRELGNRRANRDGQEWFSFRADNLYLVGAGSIHPNGNLYETMRDIEPIPVPDWVCDFVEMHAEVPKPKHDGSLSVSEDFDFDDFLDFYGISGRENGDHWYITDECPVAGYRHQGSTETGFFYDGNSFGFHCFAGGCEGGNMTVGQVIGFLNKEKGEPYKGVIWDREDEDEATDSKWQVEFLEDGDEQTAPVVKQSIIEADDIEAALNGPSIDAAPNCYTQDIDELAKELKWESTIAMSPEELMPRPEAIAIADPEERTGLLFPGDGAMYGRLAEIAKRSPALQLGWYYPALLGVASALDIEDIKSGSPWRVRGNMYVALLGGVGIGKNVHMDAAKAALFVPNSESVYVQEPPLSNGGLANQLSEDEVVTRLLFLDELISVFNACAITGSNLPSMLCSLFNKDQTGGAVRKGAQKVYGKLSILGGLAINDPADFSRVFGANTVKGMYDRFLFGYSTTPVKFNRKNLPSNAETVDVKPVHLADWVYDAKDEWIGDDPLRGRMSEHALRVAMVTAAVNGDMEITKPCLEAAFRFMEWQLRLRGIFKPGVAETKEAECYEAVYSALRERHDQQMASKTLPKGADKLITTVPLERRWKLVNFSQTINSKSYYRKYAGLIDRVRKAMVDNELIRDFKEDEADEDDNGKVKKVKKGKTPFIVIVADLK
jgi:Bifunctional DNA primase/polymerase, N-terminal